ncbi:MAG: TRAP transporter small permease [Tropicimonas sp.]|uniref:TRAP transporter small permease n=1 Tax=Tropicimonas sp. TaxID=2067044 RepID=UPI003A8B0E14
MRKALNHVGSVLADAGTAATYLAAGLILYDVIARLGFGRPFNGTTDLVAVTLVLVTFLQGIKAVLQDRLLRVTLLLDTLPLPLLRIITAVANLVGAALFLCLAWISGEPIQQAIETQEFFGTDAFRLTTWPIRVGVAILWVILALAFLAKAVEAMRVEKADD